MRYRLLSIALGMFTIASAQVSRAAPPNIVFILADDLAYGELGCYGQKKIRTPHIDELAAGGSRFTHHYSGAPVCAPARCVLMTGKHLGHAEIRGNRQAKLSFPEFSEGQHPISAQVPTLAATFRQAGYATAAIGKWGLGPTGSTGDPNKKGFDLFFGYNCQAIAHSFYPKSLWRNGQRVPMNARPIPGHRKKPEGGIAMEEFIGEKYAPEAMLAEAVSFIKQQAARPGPKPFFLYLAFIEPHVAMHPPAAGVNLYPEDWDKTPYRGESGYLPHPRPRAGYAAMVSGLDRHVGKIMETLAASGFGTNTIVIFTSDNGGTHAGPPGTSFHIGGADPEFFNSNAGLRGYKGSLHEGGIRVPMIVHYPGKVPAGKTNPTPGYFADWFPTLCAAAEIPAPADLDGENLWLAITGSPAPAGRRPMVWVYPEYGGQVAVRLGDHKILKRNLNRKNQPAGWEIYDLSKDPGETTNLAPSRPDLIEKAIAILTRETSPNPIFPLQIPASSSSPP